MRFILVNQSECKRLKLSKNALSVLFGFIVQSRMKTVNGVQVRYVKRHHKHFINFWLNQKSFNRVINYALDELCAAGLVRYDRERRAIVLPESKLWRFSDSDREADAEGVLAFEVKEFLPWLV